MVAKKTGKPIQKGKKLKGAALTRHPLPQIKTLSHLRTLSVKKVLRAPGFTTRPTF
jgi:hypothetical protein